jgi:hypothetical protein
MPRRMITSVWERLRSLSGYIFVRTSGLLAVSAGICILVFGGSEFWINTQTASWLSGHLADLSHIGTAQRNREVASIASDLFHGGTWIWDFRPNQAEKTVPFWLYEGTHYIVVSSFKYPGEQFDQHLQQLVADGATLLYKSNSVTLLSPKQAVLWTFRPQYVLNLSMDNSLTLIGYNILRDQPGMVGLLFHWYTRETTSIPYHMFIHVLDPATLYGVSRKHQARRVTDRALTAASIVGAGLLPARL